MTLISYVKDIYIYYNYRCISFLCTKCYNYVHQKCIYVCEYEKIVLFGVHTLVE